MEALKLLINVGRVELITRAAIQAESRLQLLESSHVQGVLILLFHDDLLFDTALGPKMVTINGSGGVALLRIASARKRGNRGRERTQLHSEEIGGFDSKPGVFLHLVSDHRETCNGFIGFK